MEAIWPLVGVVLGAGLTYFFGRLTASAAARREDARAEKADALRLAEKGREHAARALDVIRTARDESWKRRPDEGSYDIDLNGLGLEVAEAEIDLIPDPLLRPRLASVLNTVRFPWTLSNSSYSEGYPIETQRQGLYLLREALAAYVREEPTPKEPDALAKLAKSVDDANKERDEWEDERRAVEKQIGEEKQAEARKAAELAERRRTARKATPAKKLTPRKKPTPREKPSS